MRAFPLLRPVFDCAREICVTLGSQGCKFATQFSEAAPPAMRAADGAERIRFGVSRHEHLRALRAAQRHVPERGGEALRDVELCRCPEAEGRRRIDEQANDAVFLVVKKFD